jgi:hypothetical protein
MSESPPPAGLLPPRGPSVQSVLDKFGAALLPARAAPSASGSGSGSGAGVATPPRRPVRGSVKAARQVDNSAVIRRVCDVMFTDDDHGKDERIDGKRVVDGRLGQVSFFCRS